MAINRDKEAAVLQWLSCYNVKVRAISDLQDGMQLLKLLSTMDHTSTVENVEPGKTFSNIEKQLCAHFLSSGAARRQRYSDVQLATASVLALSALALRATSCSPTSKVAPLLKLDEATQCCIRDLIQIVSAGDDVIENLVAYLKASNVEEESFLCVATLKRRKSESFTASPTGAQTPAKRSSMSPQQRARLPAQQVKEMRMLREHINDEEQANTELRHEGSRLKEVVKRKDREIANLKERIKALQAVSSSDATSLAALHKNVEETSAQNKLLQEQVRSFEKVREDYDDVIRQNASLQAECEKMTTIQEECNSLREDLSKALSEKSDLCTKLASLEDLVGELRSALEVKSQEFDNMLGFYTNMEKTTPSSPKVLPPSPGVRVSCYTELRMVELQDANSKLRQESDRLQNELEEVTARLQTEGNAMRASIVQLEETKATLTAEVSQLNNRCTQLNVRICGLENELQLSKTTAATLESRLSIQVSQSETLRRQLADRDQQIAALEEKAAASDSMNQELLKSNTELNAALRLSEFEKDAQAERMREVVAENQKQQDSLSLQNSKVLALKATLENLEAKLAEVTSELLVSKEETKKVQQVVGILHSQLETSRSHCTELEQQLNQARHEKEAQSSKLLDMQEELDGVMCATDRLRARVQELEASEQQLNVLCSDLRHSLSERECQVNVAADENGTLLKIKEELQVAHTTLSAQLNEERKQHAELAASLQNQVKESKVLAAGLQEEKKALAEKSEKLEAELELLRSEFSQLREKNVALSNELSELARSREELNDHLLSRNGQLERVTAECRRLQECFDQSESEKATREAHLVQQAELILLMEKERAEQAAANENLRSENAALKSTLEEEKTKTEQLEASLEEANNENLSLRKDLGETRQKLDALLDEKKMLETKLSEKSASCNALQEQVSEVKTKLQDSKKQEQTLRHSNASLDLFVTECKQKLQASESRLAEANKMICSLQEQVSLFQQAIMRVNLEKECLHSSLASSETALRSLETTFRASTGAVEETRLKLQESRHRQTQLSSLVEQLQEECKSLKMVLADMSEKLSCREKELASAAVVRSNMASQIKELEDEHARLKHDNQALEDRIGDLEVKLNNQLELHRKAEEDYYECVNDRDGHKEALKQQIEELTAEVAEKAKLQAQLEELRSQLEEHKTSAATNCQLSEEKEQLERELSNGQREFQSMTDERDELYRKVEVLEKEKEALKHKLKSANEECTQKMQAAFVSITAATDRKNEEMKKQIEGDEQQALRERREQLLKQHIGEMKEMIKQSSRDMEALKAQTEEQAVQLAATTQERDRLESELAAMKQERDRLAQEKRSLNAQLSYCDAKLRERTKEADKAPGKSANQSLYSTPSLETVWSQRQLSRKNSRSSITSEDFKVPHSKGNRRRESNISSRSGKMTQAAALDSSIFSGNRFSCDEEQGHVLGDYIGGLWQPAGRSDGESETQQCPIPATPLRGDSEFSFPEPSGSSAVASTPTAPSRSSQQSASAEDASKRKRDARSSSSDDNSSKPSFWSSVGTPSKGTKPKSSRTPSSVKKFLRSKFKR
ncbi:hypothetical protein MTO96_030442 [Rhipicephalus appendiculatus]